MLHKGVPRPIQHAQNFKVFSILMVDAYIKCSDIKKKGLGRTFKLTTERLAANVELFIVVLPLLPYNISSEECSNNHTYGNML
jgi:hypothetical protein